MIIALQCICLQYSTAILTCQRFYRDLTSTGDCRLKTNTVYFPDRCVVLGHTPTQFLLGAAGNESAQGKIYRTESFIDIDCGCVYPGGRLGCLCLDTLEEIYV